MYKLLLIGIIVIGGNLNLINSANSSEQPILKPYSQPIPSYGLPSSYNTQPIIKDEYQECIQANDTGTIAIYCAIKILLVKAGVPIAIACIIAMLVTAVIKSYQK